MHSHHYLKTATLKVVNEDAIDQMENNTLQFKGVILADGIGSHYKADEGAAFCVQSLKRMLEKCNHTSELNFKELFKAVQSELQQTFSDQVPEGHSKTQAYGTTLMCVLEFEEKYVVAYIGNGSLWHIRGNFAHFSPQRYFPWSALNLLNPHTVDEGGKEVLYKFMALEVSAEQIVPSVLEISKDNSLYGELILCSTDGLYSNDHNPVAKDREGNLWIAGDRKLNALLQLLKERDFAHLDRELMNQALTDYLEMVKEQKLMDDDLTFGLVVNTVTKN